MGSRALRLRLELPLDQVAVLLHQTADALAAGVLRLGDDEVGLDALRRVRIELERRGQGLRLTIKGTPLRAPRSAVGGGGYRALKKDMGHAWKALRRSARRRELPDSQVLQTFVQQGQAMLLHVDKGPEFLQAFGHRLRALQQAAAVGEVEGWCQAVAQVERLKQAAHRRHR